MNMHKFRINLIGVLGVAIAILGFSGEANASVRPHVPLPAHSVTSVEQTGWQITGRNFGEITDSLHLPNAATFAPELQGLGYSLQLWSASKVVTLGISNTTTAGNWCPAVSVVSTAPAHTLLADSNTHGVANTFSCAFAPGDGITYMIKYNRADGNDQFVITNGHISQYASFHDPGARLGMTPYRMVRVGAEFGCNPFSFSCTTYAPVPYNAPNAPVKLGTFGGAIVGTYFGPDGNITSFPHQPVTWTRNGAASGAVNGTVGPITNHGQGDYFSLWLQP
jgi:hypothetical protein